MKYLNFKFLKKNKNKSGITVILKDSLELSLHRPCLMRKFTSNMYIVYGMLSASGSLNAGTCTISARAMQPVDRSTFPVRPAACARIYRMHNACTFIHRFDSAYKILHDHFYQLALYIRMLPSNGHSRTAFFTNRGKFHCFF